MEVRRLGYAFCPSEMQLGPFDKYLRYYRLEVAHRLEGVHRFEGARRLEGVHRLKGVHRLEGVHRHVMDSQGLYFVVGLYPVRSFWLLRTDLPLRTYLPLRAHVPLRIHVHTIYICFRLWSRPCHRSIQGERPFMLCNLGASFDVVAKLKRRRRRSERAKP